MTPIIESPGAFKSDVGGVREQGCEHRVLDSQTLQSLTTILCEGTEGIKDAKLSYRYHQMYV